jgi:hypothetical protein
MWASCLSDGAAHESRNAPIVLGGSNGGYFKQGLNGAPDLSNQDLCVNILNSFGLEDTTFGDPASAKARSHSSKPETTV